MSEKKDFEFLSGLATEFFKKRSITKALAVIDECEITGWETWLQIEFAKFFSEHELVFEWSREERYQLDQRSSNGKTACAIDFSIRQKYKQSWLALELKQKNTVGSCIKSMLRDVVKVNKIKQSHNDIRTLWCLGVHKHADKATVMGQIAKYEVELDLELNRSQILTKRIGRSDYSFTLL